MQEYRRTCRACGMVWHSLIARKQQIQRSMQMSGCESIANCCTPTVTAQNRRNIDANQSELSRLRQCPRCHSANYFEEVVLHDQPPR
jgi:hypothetical protein